MTRVKGIVFFLIFTLVFGLAYAKTNVTVELAYYSDFTKPYFDKAAKAFEAQNPDINIIVQEANWDNLFQILATDVAGKKAPNLSIIGTRWMLQFKATGAAAPMDFPQSFLDEFIPGVLGPTTVNGQLYALPWINTSRALVYNKALFQKAGLDPNNPPKTWDELKADAAKLSKLPGVYGFGLQGKDIATDVQYYYFLLGAGGQIIDSNNQSGLSSPAALKALNYLVDLQKSGLTEPNVSGNTREDLRGLFVQGRLGMFIYLPTTVGYMKQYAPQIDYGVSAIPYDTTKISWASPDSLLMFSPSVTGATPDVTAATLKFVEFLYQPSWRMEYLKGEGFLPVLKSTQTDPYWSSDPHLQGFVEQLPIVRTPPMVPNYDSIETDTINMLEGVYSGQTTPEAALKDTAAKVNAILSKQ